MAEIEQVALDMNGFGVNAYVVHARDADIVVDAGAEPEKIMALTRAPVAAVLVTHGHGDHVGALDDLLARTGAPLYMHPDDATSAGVRVFEPVDDGQVLEIAGETIRVLHTPGHSRGSVTFVLGSDQLVGDLVLPGSVGRTDMPGASWEEIEISIRKVMPLWDEQTQLYPGHGSVLNAMEELETNPYLPLGLL